MKRCKTVKQRKNDEKNAKKNTEQLNKDGAEVKKDKKAILPIVLVVVFCVAALIWALPQLPVTPHQASPESYLGVLELWNVEAFVGVI